MSLTTPSPQWSRTEFDNLFVKPAQAVNAYLSEPNYLENNLKYSGQQKEQVEQIVDYLVTKKPLTFEECIVWARLQFEDKFNNSIRQLLFSLPKDATTSTGQPFWSGPKRAPDPLTFDSNDVCKRPSFFSSSLSDVDFISLHISPSSLLLPTYMPLTTVCVAKLTLLSSRRSQKVFSFPNSRLRVV